MLCLWVLRQEGTTLTSKFSIFFGETGQQQFLAFDLFLGGHNEGKCFLLLILQVDFWLSVA